MTQKEPPRQAELPQHVAIIMDGNGRWAQARGLPRFEGHRRGVEAVRRSVRAAIDLGVSYLTLFGFSSENWKRPKDEISELMKLLRYYLRSETAELHKNNIRIRVIGDHTAFGKEISELIGNAEKLTVSNTGLTLTIALNYGGRHDILQAAQKMAKSGLDLNDDAFALAFEQSLMTKGLPDPDLLIRTSGEQRLSNFLLWQCAYSEFYFTDVLWPDFDKEVLQRAIESYTKRERRFGAVSTQNS
ncbi:MAG: isoprenyl transferase [Rhodospirillales bacterium]|nr:isoprenyl transferase [Rhodospirillales bacterium]MCB9973136.1 isoprenyl transferase [Rhodospirillales bacterium]